MTQKSSNIIAPSSFEWPHDRAQFDWRFEGLRCFGYRFCLRKVFGFRVQRVSVDARFTCPNVDGTMATGGCSFCDNCSFSPSRRLSRQDIFDQIDEAFRCHGTKRQTRFSPVRTHYVGAARGESHEDLMATAREVTTSGPDAVKIHNLYAAENTSLAEQVRSGDA